jgi:hypothetical protein
MDFGGRNAGAAVWRLPNIGIGRELGRTAVKDDTG